MDNLEVYNQFAAVPDNAKKAITGGRLKGMTDINPMWRIKTLTERYGPCGIGWKYVITDQRIIEGAGGVMCAFLNIDLFVKENGAWSEAIAGTGGSQLVSKENGGMYTNDECFKMALTDAISVACKALGMGAEVYWQADETKYEHKEDDMEDLSKHSLKKCRQRLAELITHKIDVENIPLNVIADRVGMDEETLKSKLAVYNELARLEKAIWEIQK